MQRPEGAARRFYRAFYQWTLLTSIPTPRACQPATLRYASQTSRRRRPPTQHRSVLIGNPKSIGNERSHPDDFKDERRWTTQPRFWSHPILSTEEKPSSSLKVGNLVVREKTERTITLEKALDQFQLRTLEALHGPGLNVPDTLLAVKIQVNEAITQYTPEGSDTPVPVHSVVLSGEHSLVDRMWRDKFRFPYAKILFASPVSAKKYSSKDFQFHDFVIIARERNTTSMTVEFLCLESAWETFTNLNNFEDVLKDAGASGVVGPRFKRNPIVKTPVVDEGSHSGRSVFVSGSFKAVAMVLNRLREVASLPGKLQPNKKMTNPGAERSIDIESHIDPEEAEQLSEDVRVALRALTHPVVLITSRATQDIKSDDQTTRIQTCRGVTVSSFNTVTLKPQPIVSFNVKIPSRSWDAMKASQNLRVHLLAATPNGALIADMFTKPYEHPHEGFQHLEKAGVDIFTFKGDVPPRVFLKDGVLAQMRAKVLLDRCIKVADHVIVVARVDLCKFTDESGLRNSATESTLSALSYTKKAYRGQAAEINVPRRPTTSNPNAPFIKSTPDSRAPSVTRRASSEKQRSNVVTTPNNTVPNSGDNSVTATGDSHTTGNSWFNPLQPSSPPVPNSRPTWRKLYSSSNVEPNLSDGIYNDPIRVKKDSRSNEEQNPFDSIYNDPIRVKKDSRSNEEQNPFDSIYNDHTRGEKRSSSDGETNFLDSIFNDPIFTALSRSGEARADNSIDTTDIWDEPEEDIDVKSQSGTSGGDVSAEVLNLEGVDTPLWGPENVASDESHRLASDRSRPAYNYGALGVEDIDIKSQDRASGEDVSAKVLQPKDVDISLLESEDIAPEDVVLKDVASGDVTSEEPHGLASDNSESQTENGAVESKTEGSDRANSQDGDVRSLGIRSYSTYCRRSKPVLSRRSFSTSTRMNREGRPHAQVDLESLIDPEARKTTVADFLEIPDDGSRPWINYYVRGALNAEKQASGAHYVLNRVGKELSEQKRLDLEKEITDSSRIIDMRLAMNAARDLSLMLDQGRVNFKRAAILEGMVERGLALCIERAKLLKNSAALGQLDVEKFSEAKKQLQKEHELLQTETNRLRDFMDD